MKRDHLRRVLSVVKSDAINVANNRSIDYSDCAFKTNGTSINLINEKTGEILYEWSKDDLRDYVVTATRAENFREFCRVGALVSVAIVSLALVFVVNGVTPIVSGIMLVLGIILSVVFGKTWFDLRVTERFK